jgi:hypothetical protein
MVGTLLAFQSGSLATPRAIVNAWMHSAAHRHNILPAPLLRRRHWRQARDTVAGPGDGIAYTTDFGS